MIVYNADDYGINKIQSERIIACSTENGGVLNSVSIMPNSRHLDTTISMLPPGLRKSIHINLAEGEPCADAEKISLLTKDGTLYHSFFSLLWLTITHRQSIEEQTSREILAQIRAVTSHLGEDYRIRIDSHVHSHMIPVIFKAMCEALSRSGHRVEYIRFPVEHLSIYMRTPSVWRYIRPVNIAKALLLRFFGFINMRTLHHYGYESCIGGFFGVIFTSKMYGRHVYSILKKYIKQSEKFGGDLEVLFHPGGIQENEEYLKGCNNGFKAVYSSKDREREAEMLQKLGRL